MRTIMNRSRLAMAVILFLGIGLTMANGGDRKDKKSVTRLEKTGVLEYQNFDGNRINSIMGNDGQYVSQVVTGNSGMEWPKGTFKTIDYAAGIWVAGKVGNDFRTAAAEYASEFAPGKIVSGTADDPTKPQYRWYKITRADLITPGDDYQNWPVADGAPVDSLGNPLLMGDMTMWCVFNDMNAARHANIFGTQPLGIEVQFTVWGYDRPDAFGDMMFIKAKIIHKGTTAIDSTFIALWDDPDLGDAGDDYVGCDTSLSLGYCWNADNNDVGFYGTQPPAIGRDFFQGPIVPSPGDTALVSGRRIPGYKNLPMYSFAYYINGATYPRRDPENAQEAFHYMTGRYQDGSPFINPMTSQPTRFVFPGDPVTGTGWSEINPVILSPGDRRFLMSSGPFMFSPGDTQEVVFGVLIAQGANNKNSVAVLKEIDAMAQTAYDVNFALPPSPPVPNITVTELDGEVSFVWEDNAESYVADDLIKKDTSGNTTQYVFEGYVVYQVDHPTAPTIYRTLATYDLDNMVLAIKDFKYDPNYGENVEVTVVKGTNSGLQRKYSTKMDALSGLPLVNGNPYYFVITAYAYNEWGVPHMLESSRSIITVRPHAPAPGTRWNAAVGDTIRAIHAAGLSDGVVTPIVVDPTKVTGHNYEVTFAYDAVDDDYKWTLKDLVTNTNKLQSMVQTGDGTAPFIDGLQMKVAGPPLAIKEWSFEPDADRWFTGVNWGGHEFFGGLDLGVNFFGSSITPSQYVTVEIRFHTNVADGQRAYMYLRGGSPSYGYVSYELQHFSVWDVTSNPERQLAAGYVEQAGSAANNNLWQPTASSGDREYLFIFNTDYTATPDAFYTGVNALSGAATMPTLYALWPLQRGTMPFNPQDGQVFTIVPNFVNTENDRFTFTTAGYQPTVSTELARSDINKINVFPNPYFGAQVNERDPLNRFVTFSRLPEQGRVVIRIFTLSGVLVRQIDHSPGSTFERWDLRNTDGIPVASGMYLIEVDIKDVGTKILKLGVIQPEERLDRL